MGSLNERNPSVWVSGASGPDYPAQSADVEVDVCVCGGGITGLSSAYLLQQEGLRVALVESGSLAAGTTGYTTAKVTVLHGLIYRTLTQQLGTEAARVYAEANQSALDRIAHIVSTERIGCDLTRAPAFTYVTSRDDVGKVAEEAEAATQAGVQASFTEDTDLPFPTAGAVRVDNQAHFHPRRYCLALADRIAGAGGLVFENTRALDVTESERDCLVQTSGGRVRAAHVVVATHMPFLDRALLFARATPQRSYAMTVRVPRVPEGMYLSAGSPVRSLRPVQSNGETLLIVGGENHEVGHEPRTQDRYLALEQWARENLEATDVVHRWSAQDYQSVDGLPYIGRVTARSERVWVATGFGKWGMTNGTVAAMVLADRIGGRDNPRADMLDPVRLNVRASLPEVVTHNTEAVAMLVADRVKALGPLPGIDEVGMQEGRVVRHEGKILAAARTEDGELHLVSPWCTHMGCRLSFNTAEVSWDCPCHGSRFDVDGRVIEGPALRDLDSPD